MSLDASYDKEHKYVWFRGGDFDGEEKTAQMIALRIGLLEHSSWHQYDGVDQKYCKLQI